MLICSQYKYLNCLMPCSYLWKQCDYVNKMHSQGNENCEHNYNCSRIPNCPTSGPNK